MAAAANAVAAVVSIPSATFRVQRARVRFQIMRTLPFLISTTTCGVTAAFASAQTQSFTSPAGMATVEGNASFASFGVDRRIQNIDATDLVTPRVAIRGLRMRRDGAAGGFAARTFTFSIDMGVGNFAARQTLFANNYLGAPTNVFTPKTVSMPDWTSRPSVAPAPFDFIAAPFDTPFNYLPNGTDALIWDFTHSASTDTQLVSLDRHYFGYTSGGTSTVLGAGCVVGANTNPFTHTNALLHDAGAGTMGLLPGVTFGPASTPLFLTLDFVDANLNLPGWCGTLHAVGALTLNLGVTNATGAFPAAPISFPANPTIVGATVLTQAIAFDPGQPAFPFAFSNARRATMPPYIPAAYLWAAPTATTSFVYAGGCMVGEFLY